MADALVALLQVYLSTWEANLEGFLFLNRNGRPYAANKVVEYGLWPVLEKLNLLRAGMRVSALSRELATQYRGERESRAGAIATFRPPDHAWHLRSRDRRGTARCGE